jgi:hypothetical protein
METRSRRPPDGYAPRAGGAAPRPREDSFQEFQASALFCPRCRTAQPVRERLLLVLPDGELLEYLCQACSTSVGSRRVTAGGVVTPT